MAKEIRGKRDLSLKEWMEKIWIEWPCQRPLSLCRWRDVLREKAFEEEQNDQEI